MGDFLLHHALIVDMFTDSPTNSSMITAVGMRGSVFATYSAVGASDSDRGDMLTTPQLQAFQDAARDANLSVVSWYRSCFMCHQYLAVYHACLGGHYNVAAMLVDDIKDALLMSFLVSWGLIGACRGGHNDVARMMLETIDKDDDIWAWCNWGLEVACSGGHVEIAKMMIYHGAFRCNACEWSKAGQTLHTCLKRA